MCRELDRPPVSRYDNDPRVTRVGAGFAVRTANGETFYVRCSEVLGWVICRGHARGDFLEAGRPGRSARITTADDAIGMLIGDPAPAAAAGKAEQRTGPRPGRPNPMRRNP